MSQLTTTQVFVNKRLFSHERLKHSQVTIAAFHFAVTALTLYAVSRPRINIFQAKRVPLLKILPLAISMICNVVLLNLSLAYSSIQFYQIVRVLVTPAVALMNYIIVRATIPVRAALTLIPVCVGVAVVSYFDTAAKSGASEKTTAPIGVVFAFAALFASAIYTVWIDKYHRVLDCSSMQLLLNQAPVSVGVMLFVIPFSDDITVWAAIDSHTWMLVLLVRFLLSRAWQLIANGYSQSGMLACLINLSQFLIINEAGPVSSTVVGHSKTCLIVATGWITSGKALSDGSLVGTVMAIGGIIA